MLPGISSSCIMASSAPGGGSLDLQTVTVGASGTIDAGDRARGYILGSLGAIADGTSDIYSGAQIRKIAAVQDIGFDVIFEVAGVQSNSGWSSMTVAGTTTFSRTSATFSTAGGNSSWTWFGVPNPFGVSGTKTVGFD